MVDYNEFVEFHEKHPDLDNQEYYAEFPDTNKSTIRSWKLKVRKHKVEDEIPNETEAKGHEGYEEMQSDYLKLLLNQTGSKASEFEGVDDKSTILVLKNRIKSKQLQDQTPGRGSNTSILPTPKPIGQNVQKFGLDEYIEFDKAKDEIRMEIPFTVLFDPEKNKALGEIK